MHKVNIGCGRDVKPGWINTDVSQDTKADIVHDIRCERLPIDDASADEVYCSGVLEQILDSEDLRFAINEVWRVLAPGGTFNIVVPNAEYAIACQDPFDVRRFVPKTFDYFLGGAREYLLYGSVYGFKPWKSVTVRENQRHILEVTLVK